MNDFSLKILVKITTKLITIFAALGKSLGLLDGRLSCALHFCRDVIHADYDLNDEQDLCSMKSALISVMPKSVVMIVKLLRQAISR